MRLLLAVGESNAAYFRLFFMAMRAILRIISKLDLYRRLLTTNELQ